MRFLTPLVLLFAAALGAAEPVRFFAMDTAARQAPAEAAAVLAELGYDGFGGRPATAKAFAAELGKRQVAFVNAYHVTKFAHDAAELPADLVQPSRRSKASTPPCGSASSRSGCPWESRRARPPAIPSSSRR